MDKVVEKLQNLRTITPREDWVQQNKHLLLSQIKTQAPQRELKPFSYWYFIKLLLPVRVFNFVAKPVGVISLVLLLLVSSGALTVRAAKDSLPGDFLYSVKLTSEKVGVGLTVTPEKKAEKHLQNAAQRVTEIETIVHTDDGADQKKQQIKIATGELKRNMAEVQQSLEKVKSETELKEKSKQTIETVQKVDEQSEKIAQRLTEQKEAVKTAIADIDLEKELREAVDEIDKAGVKAVEVIVTKHDAGEVELSDEDVVASVKNKLKGVEEKLQKVNVRVEDAGGKDALKDATAPEDAGGEDALKDATDPEEESLAPIEEPATDDATVETVETPEPVVADATAEELLEDAKDLVNQGDLVNALDKIVQCNELTKQVEVQLEINAAQQEIDAAAQGMTTDESDTVASEDSVIEDTSSNEEEPATEDAVTETAAEEPEPTN